MKWGECGVPMGTHGIGLRVWSDSVVPLLSPIICLYIVTGSDTVHNTSVSSGEPKKTSTEVASCKFQRGNFHLKVGGAGYLTYTEGSGLMHAVVLLHAVLT